MSTRAFVWVYGKYQGKPYVASIALQRDAMPQVVRLTIKHVLKNNPMIGSAHRLVPVLVKAFGAMVDSTLTPNSMLSYIYVVTFMRGGRDVWLRTLRVSNCETITRN